MDFTGLAETTPYLFKNFGLNHFVVYGNGRQTVSEGLFLKKTTSNTCTIAYHTLISCIGIHQEKTGIQIPSVEFLEMDVYVHLRPHA
jgi:hypothetical protein